MQDEGRHKFTFADDGKGMELESGKRLGPITLAYETYGFLSSMPSQAMPMLPPTRVRKVKQENQVGGR